MPYIVFNAVSTSCRSRSASASPFALLPLQFSAARLGLLALPLPVGRRRCPLRLRRELRFRWPSHEQFAGDAERPLVVLGVHHLRESTD